jgi:c-di-GMP-binding flagellar brake protein YcgR
LDESADLAVTIPNPDGTPFAGRLLDVSGSGAGARFPAAGCPILAVGQEIDLVFTSQRLEAPAAVRARIQHRAEEEGFRRYGFRFLDEKQLHAELPSALLELFNRRRALRVTPDPESPIAVVLEGPRGSPRAEGRLADVSAIGVGVSLDPDAESALANIDRVVVSLALPGAGPPVTLAGRIRYRRLAGAEIRYGIAFDPGQSQDFTREQDRITRYVMERQRDLLRTAARARG